LPRDPAAGARWLAGFVRPERARLAVVLGLALTSTALGLAQPYLTRYLIDDGLLAGRFAVVAWLSAAMVALGVASAGLGALNRWHYTAASARILLALREALFAHLERLSPAFHARARGGDLLTRLDGDLAALQRFAVDGLLALVNGTLALAGALALMLALSWRLTLLAALVLPAVVLFVRALRAPLEATTRALRERTGEVTEFFFSRLAAIKFIQSVAAERREAERLAGLHARFRDQLLRTQMVGYAASSVPGVLLGIGTALVFVAGGREVIEGRLSLGTLIAFSAYLARATGPAQTLLGLYAGLQRARVSLVRVLELTALEPAVTPPARPRALAGRGEIRLEAVTFRYPGEERAVLREASLRVPAGAKLAIVGVSGAGKSTLIDLLQRHFDPEAGRILLDGVDLRELDLGELRRRVAVVAQDTVLFPGTVLENLRYCAPAASREAVLEAARRAQVDPFVAALPRGYETEIGSRGMALSGGQRQRLAIARALLQDPVVLVLDEATSALDRATEARVAAAIDALFAGRTRVVISHRAATVAGAERTVELAGGRLRPLASSGPREGGA